MENVMISGRFKSLLSATFLLPTRILSVPLAPPRGPRAAGARDPAPTRLPKRHGSLSPARLSRPFAPSEPRASRLCFREEAGRSHAERQPPAQLTAAGSGLWWGGRAQTGLSAPGPPAVRHEVAHAAWQRPWPARGHRLQEAAWRPAAPAHGEVREKSIPLLVASGEESSAAWQPAMETVRHLFLLLVDI